MNNLRADHEDAIGRLWGRARTAHRARRGASGGLDFIHSSREQAWLEVMGGTRHEALLKCSQPHLANRVVWLELEAEVLRAAAQSRLPEQLVRDKIPSQLPGVVHAP